MIRLERVIDALPADFDTLRIDAQAENYGMLDTLASEWRSGTQRFDGVGEALYAAYSDQILAGIGGLTIEAAIPGAFRMRRFYVRAGFRRGGVARRLAFVLLDSISDNGGIVTCNAAVGSEAFWESLGFAPNRRDGYTHILR